MKEKVLLVTPFFSKFAWAQAAITKDFRVSGRKLFQRIFWSKCISEILLWLNTFPSRIRFKSTPPRQALIVWFLIPAIFPISMQLFAAAPTGSGQGVIVKSVTNVRSSAAGSLLGEQPAGILGATVSGPVSATLNGTAYTWFNVNFVSGLDGWVISTNLDQYLFPAPTLSAPANGATGVSLTPTFSWGSVSGANRYWLTVATSSGALPTNPTATGCTNCVITGSTGSTSHTIPSAFPYGGTSGSLSANTTYYWRVQAWHNNGTSTAADDVPGNFSSIRSFTTAGGVTSYTVTPSAGTGGTVNPNTAQTVTAGATRSFTVTPNSGYTRNNAVGGTCPQGSWSGNTWATGAINANCTVSFSFTAAPSAYTVTPSAGTGGTINPNTAQTVTAGATRSFTVTPNSGYTRNNAVGGTCPQGSWSGNTWATGAINANCTVSFSFTMGSTFPLLVWPVPSGFTAKPGQTYAQFNWGSTNKHHAGLDIPAPTGTRVNAAASGTVRVVSLIANNDKTRCLGNVVIITHSSVAATLYAHLSTISVADGTWTDQGQQIGTVGATTGKFQDESSCGTVVAHLHFELKSKPWLAKDNDGGPPNTWGYTPDFTPTSSVPSPSDHPDNFGFYDPILSIHSAISSISPTAVTVTPLGAGVSMRTGPDTTYRGIGSTLVSGQQYIAIRTLDAATTNCSSGWYQIVATNGQYFLDVGRGPLPAVWVCRGNAGQTWVQTAGTSYTITPSAGTGGTVNPNTAQTVTAGATRSFTVTPNSGYTRNNAVGGTCPQGSWSGNTWATGAINANCTVSFSFTAAPSTYTVTPSAGTGGTVNPNTAQTVTAGATRSFTVTPNSGYTRNNAVGGTCPQGSWSGNTWATGAINANCTVSFSFTAAPSTYTVTPSAGTGGTVNPNTAQTVTAGATRSFTVTPNSGYTRNNAVGGTCPQGSWSGNTWATGAINANCTVSFSFTASTTLADAVDAPGLSFTTLGNSNWFSQTAISFSGGDAAQSGAITHNQLNALQTTITGPVTLKFYWKVSSEANHDYLLFYVDGVEQARISGNQDWVQRSHSIPTGDHTLLWIYAKDSSVNGGSDAGWVDLVTIEGAPATYNLTVNSTGASAVPIASLTGHGGTTNYPKNGLASGTSVTLTAPAAAGGAIFSSWSGCNSVTGTSCTVSMTSNKTVTVTYSASALAEAVDATGISFTTSGNASWFRQTAVSFFGGDAAQTGTITHNQSSVLQTTVTGPMSFKFYWKVSSEATYDYLQFFIDGVEQARISGNQDWVQRSHDIPSGVHTLQWRYSKDGSISSESDAGWVDAVEPVGC